jgi:predicted Zn finger-like uncharacterized protein
VIGERDMIVHCKNCGTKFRFDEILIEGEGIWVRCNQCKNLFFLDNPVKKETEPIPDQEKDRERNPSEPQKIVQEQILTDREEDAGRKEVLPVGDIEKDVPDLDKHTLTGAEKDKDAEKHEDEVSEEEAGKKRVTPRGRQVAYLFIVLIIGCVYLLFFAETGGQTLFEKILGTAQKNDEVGPAQVEITDVRQRIVNNLPMGTIRIVEGTAINQSSFPMTRIKVKGEITDAYTVVLGVRESYCGNLLTDNELATMTEDQIQRELSNPQGSDVSNDRIGPQGQIPFMIVFTREPAGFVKTFVIPVGAERLLP